MTTYHGPRLQAEREARHRSSAATPRAMHLHPPTIRAGSLRQHGKTAALPHTGRSTQDSSYPAQFRVLDTKRSAIAANQKRMGLQHPTRCLVRAVVLYYIAGAGHASLATYIHRRWAQMSCCLWHCLVALPEGSFFE